MKFQNPILKFKRTDGRAQSNMPLQLFFEVGAIKNILTPPQVTAFDFPFNLINNMSMI